MRLFIVASVFLIAMAAMNLYTYRRFLRRLSPPFNRYTFVLPLALMLGEVVFAIEVLTGVIELASLAHLVLSATVGITFLLFVIAIAYDLSVTVSARVPMQQERRQFIKVMFDIGVLIAASSYLFRGVFEGIRQPVVNQVDIRLKDFPFADYSIVQLSDVHVGRTIRREFIEELVARTNTLNPDLVVITGDLVDLPIDRIDDHLEPLGHLQAPCYFIPGNHEYFHGVVEIATYLETLGIMPLMNASTLIGDDKQGFELVGINDLVGHSMGYMGPDLSRAYARTDTRRCHIVLAHQPRTVELINGHRCDLMLSGHTHGGQIFPFGLLVMAAQPYLAGLNQHNEDVQVFVSRGAGYWGPPIRILAPSEISYLKIRPA
jgi:predicted MPP superfamily phosphohydrolase